MSPPTLKDLISPESDDEVMTFLLTTLASLGFPTTNWQSGGRLYTSLRSFSRGFSQALTTISSIAKGGLLSLSTEGWLTLLAKDDYDTDRNLATFAQGTVTLNVAAGAGPFTITPSGSIIYEALTGLRYISTNPSDVTLSAGPSSKVVPYQAESPGAAYNVPLGSGIGFATPLPGVTATFTDTLGNGTWLTQFGTDDEADPTLQIRCRDKWATLGLQKAVDAYVFLAMNTPGVGTPATKVYIDDTNPRGPGTINVWLASNAGALPTSDETLIRNYLVSLKSPSASLQVQNATPLSITVAPQIWYVGAFASAIAQAQAAIIKLIQSLPIGGTLYLSKVVELIMDVPGVVNVPANLVLLNGSNADLQLTPTQIAAFAAFNADPRIVG